MDFLWSIPGIVNVFLLCLLNTHAWTSTRFFHEYSRILMHLFECMKFKSDRDFRSEIFHRLLMLDGCFSLVCYWLSDFFFFCVVVRISITVHVWKGLGDYWFLTLLFWIDKWYYKCPAQICRIFPTGVWEETIGYMQDDSMVNVIFLDYNRFLSIPNSVIQTLQILTETQANIFKLFVKCHYVKSLTPQNRQSDCPH